MNRFEDPLLKPPAPDRLHYATGELLGADDFRDEQTYHRRQLAAALLSLHGSGVLAGLRVSARHVPGRDPGSDEVCLQVDPGLALDRLGRLVEVPRPACLRLRRWFDFIARQPSSTDLPDLGDLRTAWYQRAPGDDQGTVVAEVFLAFHSCARGYTPAFAAGPFDALDASQPSRVRDGHELSLVLRPPLSTASPEERLLPPPSSRFDPWAGVAGANAAERLASARAASLEAWAALAIPAPGDLGKPGQNPPGADPTAVLLARLSLPATRPPNDAARPPGADWSAAAWPEADRGAHIDNDVRNFLFPPAALARLAGLTL